MSSESLLKALYETLPDPVLIIDANRNFIAANAAACDVFGYSEEEFIGMSPAHFYASPEEAREIGEYFYPLGSEPKSLHRRFDFRRRDGSLIPVEMTANTISESDGNTSGLVVMLRDLTEVYEARQEQTRAETILNAALASISEGFVVFDDKDRLVLCNDAYREIYPITAPAMVPGVTFEHIVRYGLERGQYPEAGNTAKSREAWLQERLVKHRNPDGPIIQQIGQERWVQIDEQMTKDGYRVGLRTDVSALRQVKNEAEQLGLIIEKVGQEVFLFDLETASVITANLQARKNLGYSLEELRGKTPLDFTEGMTPERMKATLAPVVSGETKVLRFDTVRIRKDGSKYNCRVRLERMDDGDTPMVVGFAEDITERLKIEQALESKQREFENLVQNLPDFITRAKPDTTLTYVNSHYERFLGEKQENILGRPFLDFVPPADKEDLIKRLDSLSPANPMQSSFQKMTSADGETVWILWSNLKVFKSGKPIEILSVGRDVTESQKSREQIASQARELELRNAALEQFSGIVSHDLKAPLRQIRMFADMIAEDISAGRPDDLVTFSEYISERSEGMEQMVSRLLDYSKLAFQGIKLEKMELADAVAAAWDNVAVSAAETGARLIAKADLTITADWTLMIELFQNLFANSIKYSEKGKPSVVRLNARKEEDGVSITIEDNGIGIDPQQADRIFTVFQRLHTDEKIYSGAGIGLAFCKRIAESHGGSIRLDPSYQDGARFIVTLPDA